ncbi:MAG: hydrogenase nickel incorporation protein HypB [Bacillota bacterium]
MEIKVLRKILSHNEHQAENNRDIFHKHGIVVINMMSSPGAGKTTILEGTIDRLKAKYKMAVIEGDLMTSRDAERIHNKGVPVVQINTEGGCHLSAGMIYKASHELDLENLEIIFIENVGNLVCPGAFDLGENFKVVVSSVPEGDDKPLKYPLMFQEARACILNKVDLLSHTNFNLHNFLKDVYSLNNKGTVLQLSATAGTGFDDWCRWLEGEYQWELAKKHGK